MFIKAYYISMAPEFVQLIRELKLGSYACHNRYCYIIIIECLCITHLIIFSATSLYMLLCGLRCVACMLLQLRPVHCTLTSQTGRIRLMRGSVS